MSKTEQEHARIRQVYGERSDSKLSHRYAWWRPDVIAQEASRTRILAGLLRRFIGPDMSQLDVLDVGCGTGALLRRLIEWGAEPSRLTGIDVLEDRLTRARRKSTDEIRWINGGIETFDEFPAFDLITAFTVFSSIMDERLRGRLAAGIWSRLRPGGLALVFDFRFNNPNNENVRRVRRAEVSDWWPASVSCYQSLLLAPPLARRIAPASILLTQCLEKIAPPLRSHFFYAAKKATDTLTTETSPDARQGR